MWNRTTTLPIIPLTNQPQYQARKAVGITGFYQRYWIQGKHLYLDPVPTAADTGAFVYKSNWWCEDSGGNGQKAWAADTDVGRLDEDIMKLGIIWRWLKRKGFDYAEDFNTYEKRITDAKAQDGANNRLYLNSSNRNIGPGVGIRLWSPISA